MASIISAVLFRLFPDRGAFPKFPYISPTEPRITDRSFAAAVSGATSHAFTQYFSRCSHHDSLLSDGTCYSPFGSRASLFESLETLYLLNLRTEFRQAREAVAALSVGDFGWVNRHEFWGRVIGSLIGTFLLTGDELFIEKAIHFAEPLLSFQSVPFPTFVCMNCDEPSGNSSGFGTCLADCAAGLPEIASLCSLTKNKKYLSAFQFMLSQLPRPVSGTYFDFYRTNRVPAGRHHHMNGHQVGFFVNVGLAGPGLSRVSDAF
jgi:hypothetical protein